MDGNVELFASSDDEVAEILDRYANVPNLQIVLPRAYISIVRGLMLHHAKLFPWPIPLLMSESIVGRAITGALALAKEGFPRHLVTNYVSGFPLYLDENPLLPTAIGHDQTLSSQGRQFLQLLAQLSAVVKQDIREASEEIDHFLREVFPESSRTYWIDHERIAGERWHEALYRYGVMDEPLVDHSGHVIERRRGVAEFVSGIGNQLVANTEIFVFSCSKIDREKPYVLLGCYEGAEHLEGLSPECIDGAMARSVPRMYPDRWKRCEPDARLILHCPIVATSPKDFIVVADEEDHFTRYREVVNKRQSDQCTEFDGNVDANLVEIPKPMFVTSVEAYERCGFRYFLDRHLELAPADEVVSELGLNAIDRGNLIHDVLYAFFQSVEPRTNPLQNWSPDERELLQAVFTSHWEKSVGSYEHSGAFARAEWAFLSKRLSRFLDTDESFRSERGVIPVSQEVRFGGAHDEVPAVRISPANVYLRGRVDRVDMSLDKSRIVISDYKTGSAERIQRLEEAIEQGEMQLPLYAHAWQSSYPDAQVWVQKWFVLDDDQSRATFLYSGEIAALFEARLSSVLAQYQSGDFLPNPGDIAPWGFSHCATCPYDSVCSADRGVQFLRKHKAIA